MTLKQIYGLCLRQGDTCFDIGANIGQTTEIMAPLVGPTGRCYSFECHPVHYTRLAFLASRPEFENVRPYCCALSDQLGHILLYTGSDPGATQASTIIPELGNHRRLGASIARIKVETNTIDQICKTHNLSPQVIKIDVEGAEPFVIAGGRDTITRCLPHITFEFGYDHFKPGQPPPFQFPFLQELGYEFYLVDLMFLHAKPGAYVVENTTLFPLSIEDIVRFQIGGNILALHQTKSAKVLKNISLIPFHELEPRLRPVEANECR